jgi:hypothetical protein
MNGNWIYNPATNTVTVTGGSPAAPVAWADFVLADRAGSLTLLNAGAIAQNPQVFSLATQPRPCEKGQIRLTVFTSANRAGATCTLTGTDGNGDPISEVLDLSTAHTSPVTTVLKYGTVNASGISVAGMENGDTVTVTQPQWGVMWDWGNSLYGLAAKWQIGDGTTPTYLADTNRTLVIFAGVATGNNQSIIALQDNATLQLGTLIDATAKTTKDGCQINWMETTYSDCYLISNGGTLKLYSCSVKGNASNGKAQIYREGATLTHVYNCSLYNYIMLTSISAGDIYNVFFNQPVQGLANCSCTISKVNIIDAVWYSLSTNHTITVKDVVSRSPAVSFMRFYEVTLDSYVINVDADAWTITWQSTCTGVLYRQYTIALHVTDGKGNNLSEAAVTLKNHAGNTVFSVTSGVDGRITEQTVSRGYYDQAHGNTLQDYGPHTLTVTKTGFQDYRDTITLDRKMDLEIALATLKGDAIRVIQEMEIAVAAAELPTVELEAAEISVELSDDQ